MKKIITYVLIFAATSLLLFSICALFPKGPETVWFITAAADGTNTITIAKEGKPFLFGSQNINVYANGKMLLKTTLANGGKILYESNYLIEWIDNQHVILVLKGEKQRNECIAIRFETSDAEYEITNASPFESNDVQLDGIGLLIGKSISFSLLDSILGPPSHTKRSDGTGTFYLEFREYEDIQFMFHLNNNDDMHGYCAGMVSKNEEICFIKDIVAGDDMTKVLSRFPMENCIMTADLQYGEIKLLYGETSYMNSGGFIVYEENMPAEVRYTDAHTLLVFYLDSNRIVTDIFINHD